MRRSTFYGLATWALGEENRAPGIALLRYVFQRCAVGNGLLNRLERDTLLETGPRRPLARVSVSGR